MNEDTAANRRRVRTSARQFELILDFMETHPNLAASRLGSTFTIRDRRREWNEFANFLNGHQLGVHKDSDKWRKVWNDFKSATKQKAVRIAAGRGNVESLTPIEERLLRILKSCATVKKEQPAPIKSETGTVTPGSRYETDDGVCIDWPSSRSQGSNEMSPSVDAVYGDSREEYIVPTPEGAISPDMTVSDRIIVLSDVRSLVGSKSPHQIKEEIIHEDDEVVSVEFQPRPAVQDRPSVTDRAVQSTSRRPDHHPSCNGVLPATAEHSRRHPFTQQPPSSTDLEKKARLEVEVLVATKRKLEAEERRADAEAEFFREEKRRAMSLIALHEEECRRTTALAEFHREEKRKAQAKAELLLEHRRFYVEQQRTEVIRRKLVALELKKARQGLKTVE